MEIYEVRHQRRPYCVFRTRLVTEDKALALQSIGELGRCFLFTWENGVVLSRETFGIDISPKEP